MNTAAAIVKWVGEMRSLYSNRLTYAIDTTREVITLKESRSITTVYPAHDGERIKVKIVLDPGCVDDMSIEITCSDHHRSTLWFLLSELVSKLLS